MLLFMMIRSLGSTSTLCTLLEVVVVLAVVLVVEVVVVQMVMCAAAGLGRAQPSRTGQLPPAAPAPAPAAECGGSAVNTTAPPRQQQNTAQHCSTAALQQRVLATAGASQPILELGPAGAASPGATTQPPPQNQPQLI